MHWEQPVQYASVSDIGFRRRNNQDKCSVQICPDRETWERTGHLFIVADGMGGHAVGELASKIAVDTIPHTLQKLHVDNARAAVRRAIETANAAIYERGTHNRDFQRMGTTCTALMLTAEGAVIGHVGDSRAYRVRENRIDQLSFDHSLQWELLKQGRMKPEDVYLHEPRHVITRSLGPEPAVDVDVEGPHIVLPGDTFVVCSDGLTNHLSDAEIGMITAELEPAEACRLLVHLANLRGGSDNITVITARVGDLPENVVPARDEQPPEEEDEGPSWWELGGLWGIAGLFVLGVLLLLLDRPAAGWSLTGLSVLLIVGVVVYLWRKRQGRLTDADLDPTRLSRPYQTASAAFNRDLLSELASAESELQRSAIEEGWSIDWSAHEKAYRSAHAALAAGDEKQAFRFYAQAIDVLMSGVHLHRKQKTRQAKWKKPTPSAGNAER